MSETFEEYAERVDLDRGIEVIARDCWEGGRLEERARLEGVPAGPLGMSDDPTTTVGQVLPGGLSQPSQWFPARVEAEAGEDAKTAHLKPLIAEFERREDEFRAAVGTLQWVSLHPDKHGARSFAHFAPTFEAAARWAAQQYGDGPYLIRQIDASILVFAPTILASPPPPSEEDAPLTRGEGYATLVRVIQTMRHALTFIGSRERMHPDGVKLYRIDLACLESLAEDFATQPAPPSEEDAALIADGERAAAICRMRAHPPGARTLSVRHQEVEAQRHLDDAALFSRLSTRLATALRNERKEPE